MAPLDVQASNVGLGYMHLTNYAINKRNEDFVASSDDDGDSASKLCLRQLEQYITKQGA